MPICQAAHILDTVKEQKLAVVGHRHRVTGLVPTVFGQFLCGLFGLAVIATEARSATHLKLPFVRDPVFQRFAVVRVALHPAAAGFQLIAFADMRGQKADFGRAIHVAQLNPHRVEHTKDVRCHQGAAAHCVFGLTKAKIVAQVMQHQSFGKGKLQACGKAGATPLQPFHINVVADLHAPVVHRIADFARPQHPGLNDGGEIFPLARAEHQCVDRQFANVGQYVFRAFGEIDDHGRDQTDRQAENLFRDPGRRNVGQVFGARRDFDCPHHPRAVVEQVAMADDNALGFSRGPRGIGQQGGIVRPSTFYVFFKSGGFLGVDLTPCRAHTFKRMQQGMIIAPQTGIVPVNDRQGARVLARNLDAFIDLLLILCQKDPRLRVFGQIQNLFSVLIRIDRQDFAA